MARIWSHFGKTAEIYQWENFVEIQEIWKEFLLGPFLSYPAKQFYVSSGDMGRWWEVDGHPSATAIRDDA